MLGEGFAIVADIGKTHAKLSLWSRDGHLLERVARANVVQDDAPFRPLDVAGTADWLIESLARFAGHPVEAIIPVAHGAAVAGIRNGKLAFVPPDYEWPIPEDVLAEYRQQRDSFAVTGSPAFPGGLNVGSQLHYLEMQAPALFREATLLPYAQYWAWLLSGVAVSEVTSLGCHSDLWSPAAADFSPMAKRRGWAGQFAPLAKAGDVVGTLLPELAAHTGLSPAVRIHAGLHDSNAALVAARSFAEIEGREATVLSTGTWFVAMRTGKSPLPFRGGAGGGGCPAGTALSDSPHPNPSPEREGLSALPEARDCLVNVDVHGQPVPSARWMGGRELELLSARIDQPGINGLGEVLASGAMLLPALVGGCGPYPDSIHHWTGEPAAPSQRTAAIALYAALLADTQLDLIGAQGTLLIEGRFAMSELFTRALARLRTDTGVYIADREADVSFGALRMVDPALRPLGTLRRVEPLAESLDGYRANWREHICKHREQTA